MNVISHKGVVKDIEGKKIKVEIVSASACSECHAKTLCTMSDKKIKEILVNRPKNMEFEKGENVNVVMDQSMGMRAVFISYILPLIILLVLLLILLAVMDNELVVGCISIGGIAIYYFLLYLFHDRIDRKFKFRIEKL